MAELTAVKLSAINQYECYNWIHQDSEIAFCNRSRVVWTDPNDFPPETVDDEYL